MEYFHLHQQHQLATVEVLLSHQQQQLATAEYFLPHQQQQLALVEYFLLYQQHQLAIVRDSRLQRQLAPVMDLLPHHQPQQLAIIVEDSLPHQQQQLAIVEYLLLQYQLQLAATYFLQQQHRTPSRTHFLVATNSKARPALKRWHQLTIGATDTRSLWTRGTEQEMLAGPTWNLIIL